MGEISPVTLFGQSDSRPAVSSESASTNMSGHVSLFIGSRRLDRGQALSRVSPEGEWSEPCADYGAKWAAPAPASYF